MFYLVMRIFRPYETVYSLYESVYSHTVQCGIECIYGDSLVGSFGGKISVMVQWRWNFRSRFSVDVLCQLTGPDLLWS